MSQKPQNTDQSARPQGAAALAALIERARKGGRGPAPVEKWEPPFCGDIDMEIRRDGTWFYMGTPIGRKALVELFATVLRKDADGKTYLVTPVEKIGIRVEDAPFVGVELVAQGEGRDQVLTIRTNVGDVVRVDAEHGLRFETEPGTGGVKPYVRVRGRLDALLTRSVMHQLIGLGSVMNHDGREVYAVQSSGMVFPVMDAAELAAQSEQDPA